MTQKDVPERSPQPEEPESSADEITAHGTDKSPGAPPQDEDTLSDGERKLILESAWPKAATTSSPPMDEQTIPGTDPSVLLESARPRARFSAEPDDETTLTGEQKLTFQATLGAWDDAPTRIMPTQQKISFVDAEKAAVSSKRFPKKPQPPLAESNAHGEGAAPAVAPLTQAEAASPTKSSPQASSASARPARVKPPLPQRAAAVSPVTAAPASPVAGSSAAARKETPSVRVVAKEQAPTARQQSPSTTWEEESPPAPIAGPSQWEDERPPAPIAPGPSPSATAPPREAKPSYRPPAPAPATPLSSVPPPPRSRLPLLLVLLVPAAAGGAALNHYLQAKDAEEARRAASAPPMAMASRSSERAPVLTLTERAAAGEAAAIGELSARAPDKLTVAETLALAKGRRITKQRELEQFGKELQQESDLSSNSPQLARLRAYIADSDVAADALALAAKAPGPLGPDVLHDAWANSQEGSEIARLAETLLHSNEVAAKASPALKVVIDLQRAKDCQAVRELLPQAKASADQRAVPTLKKLVARRGCGEDKLDDCYPCLRDVDTAPSVQAALTAARQRPSPKL